MVRANDERGQQQRAATQQQSTAMLQQREADERRHEENMTALKALIAGCQTAAPETVAERTTGREQRAPDAVPRRRDLEVERLSRSHGAQVPAPALSFATNRGAGAPPALARAGPATTPLAGAKLDLPGDLFSVFRARLAADGGIPRKPGKRGARPRL